MKKPFFKFEILELSSGWGVARAPHGEIVGTYEFLSDAKIASLEFEQEIQGEVQYWLIDDFICEAGFGNVVGELPYFNLKNSTVLRMTQEQFDNICEIYFKEHGHYPNS